MIQTPIIPIFIYHESDQKPSKGLGKKQSYLKYVVKQAEALNKRVLLFGDEFNKTWAKEWYQADLFISEKWKRFSEAFVNMSDYPAEWSLGIFKRFFIFEEYCIREKIIDFVVLDSDVLLYIDVDNLHLRESCQVAFEWANDVDVKHKPTKAASVVCGIGYFTLNKLIEFTNFCISVYEDKASEYYSILENHWNFRRENGLSGGACEMTLLYLWLADQKGIGARNLLELAEGGKRALNDINGKLNLYENEYKIDRFTNTKLITFKDGFPQVKRSADGKWVTVIDIHFGGDSKRFLGDYYKYGHRTAFNWIYYVLLHFYRNKIKPVIKRR